MKTKKVLFDQMESEDIGGGTLRRYLSTENMTLTYFTFAKGAHTPLHSHPNEQISYIIKGSVLFKVDGEEFVIKKGEVLLIPGDAKHEATALEESLNIEIFSPPRKDWEK